MSSADDAWTTASTHSYSIDRIYAGTSDTVGQTTKHVSFPTSVVNKFSDMRERRELPPQLETWGPYCRNAVVHRLKYDADNGFPAADELANTLIQIAEIEREEAIRQAQGQMADRIEKSFYNARSDSDHEGVQNVLMIANAGISTMRPHFAQRVERIIEQAQDFLR